MVIGIANKPKWPEQTRFTQPSPLLFLFLCFGVSPLSLSLYRNSTPLLAALSLSLHSQSFGCVCSSVFLLLLHLRSHFSGPSIFDTLVLLRASDLLAIMLLEDFQPFTCSAVVLLFFSISMLYLIRLWSLAACSGWKWEPSLEMRWLP